MKHYSAVFLWHYINIKLNHHHNLTMPCTDYNFLDTISPESESNLVISPLFYSQKTEVTKVCCEELEL